MSDPARRQLAEVITDTVLKCLRQKRTTLIGAMVQNEQELKNLGIVQKDTRQLIFVGIVITAARYAALSFKGDTANTFCAAMEAQNREAVEIAIESWMQQFSDKVLDKWIDGFRSHVPKRMFQDRRQIVRIVEDIVSAVFTDEEIEAFKERYTTEQRARIALHVLEIIAQP